jgi:hypothetical protein
MYTIVIDYCMNNSIRECSEYTSLGTSILTFSQTFEDLSGYLIQFINKKNDCLL